MAQQTGGTGQPLGSGGAADVQARKLAELLSKELGQPVVVRNVTGAGGAIAYNKVVKDKPDGYSVIWYSGAINTLSANKQISFDYTAFDPIAVWVQRRWPSPSTRMPPGRT